MDEHYIVDKVNDIAGRVKVEGKAKTLNRDKLAMRITERIAVEFHIRMCEFEKYMEAFIRNIVKNELK